ncbi:hypothetical protein SUDANB121_05803 [Nocardiopsis dassonvillei]|uniref:hypothetical protein n=1 Tax=Nocardiopsis dassonvillei TaxID=2014 RepID=UPI003F573BC3
MPPTTTPMPQARAWASQIAAEHGFPDKAEDILARLHLPDLPVVADLHTEISASVQSAYRGPRLPPLPLEDRGPRAVTDPLDADLHWHALFWSLLITGQRSAYGSCPTPTTRRWPLPGPRCAPRGGSARCRSTLKRMATQPAGVHSMITRANLSRIRGRLLRVLEGAAPARTKHTQIVERDGEPHPLWVFDQRDLLTAAVNREHACRGLPTVTSDAVHELEVTAGGHRNYAHKLPWRLAELACGLGGSPASAGVAPITWHRADG